MQLRVARLCLDCEELHTGDCCPVCASERYAFISTWLPSEERRRWRRPGPRHARAGQGPFRTLQRAIDRWMGDADAEDASGPLKTRASDHVPNLDFEEPGKEPRKHAARTAEPVKGDVR